MPNGKTLSIEEAARMIKTFERQETSRQTPIGDLAIGQKLDLTVLQDFLDAIKNHDQPDNIDAIRIYIARSTRADLGKELYDLVLVPVLKSDVDLHKVYDREAIREECSD